MRHLIARRRREAAKPTVHVVHHMGRPVASSDDMVRARSFVYQNAEVGTNVTTHWTGTGKFMIDSRFTGWEVREVFAL